MGLFSFWTGKSREDGSTGPTDAPTAPPEAVLTESGVGAAAADTPFVPPPAWDIDTAALTAPAPAAPEGSKVGPADPQLTAELQGPIIEVIKTVYDPEIPVDIYELGLIYDIGVDADRRACIKMTLTSPACPSAQQLPSEVRYKVKAVPGISDAVVDIVWEPPWDKDRMSDVARLQLGFL
jgi:FeS assembly SUF system protein